jgi:hypothetical protein
MGEAVLHKHESEAERRLRVERLELLERCPIPRSELLENLLLFADRRALTRVLGLAELYRRIVDVPGVVMEFGVQWGRDLAAIEALRGMFEPYNHTRQIVGFDTFDGFPEISERDGEAQAATPGAFATRVGYHDYLRQLLALQERGNPVAHVPTTAVIKGDVRRTLADYLDARPETIIALAYFDLDLYEPTKACLELIRPYLLPGSVVAFDELCHVDFPGETVALREADYFRHLPLCRLPHGSHPSFLVMT